MAPHFLRAMEHLLLALKMCKLSWRNVALPQSMALPAQPALPALPDLPDLPDLPAPPDLPDVDFFALDFNCVQSDDFEVQPISHSMCV